MSKITENQILDVKLEENVIISEVKETLVDHDKTFLGFFFNIAIEEAKVICDGKLGPKEIGYILHFCHHFMMKQMGEMAEENDFMEKIKQLEGAFHEILQRHSEEIPDIENLH